jgi:hypothetical protein
VKDALEHSCFYKIRKESKEIKADHVVVIDFEEEILDKEMLRKVFLKLCHEISHDSSLRK